MKITKLHWQIKWLIWLFLVTRYEISKFLLSFCKLNMLIECSSTVFLKNFIVVLEKRFLYLFFNIKTLFSPLSLFFYFFSESLLFSLFTSALCISPFSPFPLVFYILSLFSFFIFPIFSFLSPFKALLFFYLGSILCDEKSTHYIVFWHMC